MKGTLKKAMAIILAVAASGITGCTEINDSRIPLYQVYLNLAYTAQWELYGPHSYGDYRKFIKSSGIPANYPYTATTYTGFGGILLVIGYDFTTQDYNMPVAYDLACPYEARAAVRIEVDESTFEAYCPTCGSRYNITEGGGIPVSGPAHEYNYGLRRYTVNRAQSGGYIITN